MKKGKNIFIIVFSLLILGMSAVTVSLYDNVKDNVSIEKKEMLEYRFQREFQFYTLSLVNELEPNYDFLSFEDYLPNETKGMILTDFKDLMQGISYAFLNDNDFSAQVTNSKDGTTIAKNMDNLNANDKKEDYYFYAKLSFDENGNCTLDGDIQDQSFCNFSVYNLFDNSYEFVSYQTENEEVEYWESALDYIKINRPKNIEVEYFIPKEITDFGFISSYIHSWENYSGFVGIVLLMATLLLALFMLFYPIKYVESTHPFKTIKSWKAEFILPLLGMMIGCGIMLCMVICGNTLNGYLESLLVSYGIDKSNTILLVMNYLVWSVMFVMIAMGLFQCKYICAHGIGRYLKEDTLIGSFFRYCKQKLDFIAGIDLSSSLNKTILKYVVVNGIIVMIMICFWGFGLVFALIYILFTFVFIKKKVEKIQNDYNRLLYSTKELGKGNFNEEITSDLGIFNSLKDEFNNIKNGFEKAVEEETKSQNMKTELISNVSHDLKTPLTCIKNYIVLLQDDQITDEQRHEYLEGLNQYSNRLATLIEDLFEVSKANSGNIQISPVQLNIVALLEQTFAENEEALHAKDLKVVKKWEKEEVILELDGDKTYRIFENLFTNISKYAMPHSRVYLALKDEGDKVIIEFKNVSEVQMDFDADEISERFVRGDKSRHEMGSGLGLAIAKSFTEIQGGQFSIDIDCDLFKVKIAFSKNNQA